MAKFGWNEEKLFYVDNMSMQDTSGDPGAPSAEEGSLKLYASDDAGSFRLYIRDASDQIMIPIDAVDAPNITGQSLVQGKNSDGELEFYGIKSSSGHLDIALVDDDIVFTVDLSDINDELDHGVLQGLSDDDHAQYLLLAGRSGGQVAEGGIDASDDLELKSTDHSTKGEVKIVDGSDFRFNNRLYKEATVTTTDAAESADAFTIALDEQKAYKMRVDIVCETDDDPSTERGMWEQSQGAYRVTSGAAAFRGNQKSHYKTRSTEQMQVDFELDGNNVKVVVDQGTLTADVKWRCQIEILEIS